MSAPRILVTGASGLLGGCLVERLRARGVSMRLTDMVPPPDDRAAGSEFVTLDLRDADSVARVCRDVEVVYHLAAGQRMKPRRWPSVLKPMRSCAPEKNPMMLEIFTNCSKSRTVS